MIAPNKPNFNNNNYNSHETRPKMDHQQFLIRFQSIQTTTATPNLAMTSKKKFAKPRQYYYSGTVVPNSRNSVVN